MNNRLTVRAVEATQRAENGGRPLDNETAHARDLGHGTSLLIVCKRDLVAFLKRVRVAIDGTRDEARETFVEAGALLSEWDTFVEPVRPEERPPVPPCERGERGR